MNVPRLMIAAQSSGSGKTTVTCGILQALVNRGMKVSSFKCGPDYIDPMFHRKVIGADSANIDTYFCDDNLLKYLFSKNSEGSDIAVIEGVMGFYDGSCLDSSKDSSCDISLKLNAPAILIVDSFGSSYSNIAVLKGFLELEKNSIKGVIFNRMSGKVFESVKHHVEEMGIIPVGYIPNMKDIRLESRHLGLVMPDEISGIKEMLNELAERFEKTLDIDALIRLAGTAAEIKFDAPKMPENRYNVRIAVADDEAFCFMYHDNLALLESMGAEIVKFSPIHDKTVPKADALILYGGYPENYAEVLSENHSMIDSIGKNLSDGMPCLAECGGFMYLHERMEGADGRMYGMCGIIKGETKRTQGLVRFGYVELHSPHVKGAIKAHEFHHWDSDSNGDDWTATDVDGNSYKCIHDDGQITAGFPHLYYYSNPAFAESFLKKASEYGKNACPTFADRTGKV